MTVNTPAAKAALLLRSLGPETAENVLNRLGPEYGVRLRAEMQRLDQSSTTEALVNEVLREFGQLLESAADNKGKLPVPAAETELSSGRAATKAEAPPPLRIVIPPPPEPEPVPEEPKPRVPHDIKDPVVALRWVEPDHLAAALQGEHAHTVALVLNCMEAEEAGEILKRLLPEMRREVTLRLSRGVSGAVPVLQRVARALLQ